MATESTDRPMVRTGGGGMGVVIFALLVVVGGGAMAWFFLRSTGEASAKSNGDEFRYQVTRGQLTVTVTEDGNVESDNPIVIKNLVKGGSKILFIVADGTNVVPKGTGDPNDKTTIEVGDVIVRLDESKIEDGLDSQEIVFGNAQTALIQAEKDLAVAVISVREYEEGTYIKELQIKEGTITIAMENLRAAENQFLHTRKMFRKAFVTELQLRADEFAVERTKIELATAETDRRVLVDYTRAKMLEDLRSKVKTCEAKLRSEKAGMSLEQRKLTRLRDQKKFSVITAPAAGMLVYANVRSRWGGQGRQIEEGATVDQDQAIFRLSDSSKMQVKVPFHESNIDQITIGMPATVKIQDRVLDGHVAEKANQAEQTSWFQAKIKEYATVVKLDGATKGLVPGMTAEVSVEIENHDDVLLVPVQAVVERDGEFFCWVDGPDGLNRTRIELKRSANGDQRVVTDSKMLAVESGVSEDQYVMLNARDLEPKYDEFKKKRDGGKGSRKKKGDKKVDAKDGPGGPRGQKGQYPGGGKGERSRGAGGPSKKGGGKGHRPGGADGPSKKGGEQGSGNKKPGGGGGFDLMQFDKDKDGAVSKSELPERMQRMFDFLDTNQDGKIDKAEVEAAAAAMKKRQEQGGGRPGGGGPPTN